MVPTTKKASKLLPMTTHQPKHVKPIQNLNQIALRPLHVFMAPIAGVDHLCNALVTSEQLSRLQDGASLYSSSDAQSIRFVQGQLTQAAGVLLRLPQEVIANALVVLQRFWLNYNIYQDDKVCWAYVRTRHEGLTFPD